MNKWMTLSANALRQLLRLSRSTRVEAQKVTLALVGFAVAATVHVRAAAHDGAVENFKRLLESPPVIEKLIVREKLPPVPGGLIPADVGVSLSTNYATYEVRWQTNGMSVRTLDSNLPAAALRAYKASFTLWNDDFWFLDSATNAFVYRMEHEKVKQGRVPPSYDAAWYRITRYGEILNLGLSHIRPGSVRWQGDSFSAAGLADKKSMTVTGEIGRLTNGIPCELNVHYSNDTAVVQYRLAYEYGEPISPLYPRRVTLFVRHGEKDIEYRAYEVLSVKTSTRPKPETHFDPDGLLRSSSMHLRYLTNDSVYLRLPSGKLLLSGGSSLNVRLSNADYYRNRYFYLCMGLMAVVFFRAALRTKTEPN